MRKPRRLRTVIPVVLAGARAARTGGGARALAHGGARLPARARPATRRSRASTCASSTATATSSFASTGYRPRRSRGAAGAAAAGRLERRVGQRELADRDERQARLADPAGWIHLNGGRTDRLARPPALAAAASRPGPAGKFVVPIDVNGGRAAISGSSSGSRRPAAWPWPARRRALRWPASCSRSGGGLRAAADGRARGDGGLAALVEVTTFAVRDAHHRRSRVAPDRDRGDRRRRARGARSSGSEAALACMPRASSALLLPPSASARRPCSGTAS